jgi:hypothetical protein
MKYLPYLISFIAGALLCYLFMKPDKPEPVIQEVITYNTFQNRFPAPKLGKGILPVVFTIVAGEVRTDTVTIHVPTDMPRDFRLYYGNLRHHGDRIEIPFWNPTLRRYEVETHKLRQPRLAFGYGLSGLYDFKGEYGIELDAQLRYRAVTGFIRAGYLVEPYLVWGVRYAF